MTRARHLLGAFATAALANFGAAATAQDDTRFVDAFSGPWFAFDVAARAGEDPCRIDLDQGDDAPLPARTSGCAETLAGVSGWRIEGGMIHLIGGGGDELASLGGNQFRMTGEVSQAGTSLILDRAEGDGTGADLARAVRRHGCYFSGFASDCAAPEALAAPPRGRGRITALADVNVRVQPRREAEILGVVERGSSIATESCLQTADGYWCRASFGDAPGWIAKSALRQDEWPVVTFVAETPSGD